MALKTPARFSTISMVPPRIRIVPSKAPHGRESDLRLTKTVWQRLLSERVKPYSSYSIRDSEGDTIEERCYMVGDILSPPQSSTGFKFSSKAPRPASSIELCDATHLYRNPQLAAQRATVRQGGAGATHTHTHSRTLRTPMRTHTNTHTQ